MKMKRTLGGASDLGCERTGEATSSLAETPLRRRFTRSALKLQDEETELGSKAGGGREWGGGSQNLNFRELLREQEYYVVTPNLFETHAGSGNKRPPEYIYLENGKSLRDVLNACKANRSDSLALLELADQCFFVIHAFCQKESDPSHTQSCDAAPRSPLAGPSSPVPSSCQPEVPERVQKELKFLQIVNLKRNVKEANPESCLHHKAYSCFSFGRDLRMHKSVLAEDLLPDGTALSYVMHGEISPSQFEAHAGFASRRKPYMSIYTSNGVSLHQLSLELSRHRKSSPENDDLCSICEDGGNLLCCENCPRAFHTGEAIVKLSKLMRWSLKYPQEHGTANTAGTCLKRKECEPDANAIAAGRVPGVDPLADITQRCIRIVATFEDVGGCGICRGHDFSKSGFNGRTVIICDQALPEGEWFCCQQCSNVNSSLQKLIADGEQKLPEALSNILKKKSDAQGPQQNPEPVIRWRLLSGKKSAEDTRVWLSGAVAIFHDRFDPIADSSTGRLDLIPHMVYGSAFKDQDFCGMYCAILMVDSVVVSAGIVRIFGEEVAELPLVATRADCQGKNHCGETDLGSKNLARKSWTDTKRVTNDDISRDVCSAQVNI
ncbi:hypothetical protein DH2020_021168 [Rehmannia glutinosa]|uniref:Uncharacterized protein n=1 Tax=Rehmannia glutinosa TaxID=99300 RepID=A0ABR0WBX0_REHGL